MKKRALLGCLLIFSLMMSGNALAQTAYGIASTSSAEYYSNETVTAYIEWAPYDSPEATPSTFYVDWAEVTIYIVPGNESGPDPVHEETKNISVGQYTWPQNETYTWDQIGDDSHELVERGWYHIEIKVEGSGHNGETNVPFFGDWLRWWLKLI